MKTAVALLALFWLLPSLGAAQPTKTTNAQNQESYDFEAIQRNLEGVPAVQPADEPDPFATMTDSLEKWPEPENLDHLRGLIGYPPMARDAEIEGKVIVRVLVDRSRHYVKHIVLADPHPILTKAVTDRLSQLTFTPGIQNGKPVSAWVTIPFEFLLLKPEPQTVYLSLEDALAAPSPDLVEVLHLNGKGLRQFPLEVLRFQNLRRLNLSENALVDLPTELKSLSKLFFLDLSSNQFATLPAFLWEMPKLGQINLNQNTFPKKYQKALQKTHDSILFPKDYLGDIKW
jgi:Leucine-rich repeat (LRR) protein